MRRIVSSILLLASATVFIGSAGMTVALIALGEAALWFGVFWGLLFLTEPVMTIGLLCLVFGVALRWMPLRPHEPSESPPKLFYRLSGWLLFVFGLLLILDHKWEVVVFAMTAQQDLGLFAFLPVLDPKLPIGVATMCLGVLVVRHAPRQDPLYDGLALPRA